MPSRFLQNRSLDFSDHPVGVMYGRDELRSNLLPYRADRHAMRGAQGVIICDAVSSSTRASTYQHAALEHPSSRVIGCIRHPPATSAEHAAPKWMGKKVGSPSGTTSVRFDQ